MTDHPTIHPHHERTDVNVRPLAWIAIGFVVLVAIVFSTVWWMYGYIREQDQIRDVRRTLIPPASAIPPEPRLQVNPQEDFLAYKREEDRILNSYEWISREEGRVRISIQRAMDLVVERGMPVQAGKKEEK